MSNFCKVIRFVVCTRREGINVCWNGWDSIVEYVRIGHLLIEFLFS